MASEVRVSNRSNLLLGLFIGAFALIFAAGSAPLGGVPGVFLVILFLGLFILALVRGARMAVLASSHGLTIKNFGRDYQVPWTCVESIEAGRSDNITGAVTTLYVRRTDGSTVVARAASSYSHTKVERWRDVILSVRPTNA